MLTIVINAIRRTSYLDPFFNEEKQFAISMGTGGTVRDSYLKSSRGTGTSFEKRILFRKIPNRFLNFWIICCAFDFTETFCTLELIDNK
jgi:hypothetical protein